MVVAITCDAIVHTLTPFFQGKIHCQCYLLLYAVSFVENCYVKMWLFVPSLRLLTNTFLLCFFLSKGILVEVIIRVLSGGLCPRIVSACVLLIKCHM